MRTRSSLSLAGALLAAAAPASQAQTTSPQVNSHIALAIEDARQTRDLVVPVGKAVVIDLPGDARDVVLSNPEVADAVVRTARRVFLMGRRLGQTNAFFFDAQGRPLANLNVRVEPDASGLNAMIARIAPNARAQAESMGGLVVLTGSAPTAADAERIVELTRKVMSATNGAAQSGASQGGGTAGASQLPGANVVNAIAVDEEEQVLVKVRIVEMNRTLVKQLGIDVNAENIVNGLISNETLFDLATSNGYSVANQLLGGLSGTITNVQRDITTLPDGSTAATDSRKVAASIQAFERAGLARILAEPNLTAISGESAKFLAGGEFPIPTAADNGQIAIQFRPFGVGLAVTPLVLSGGRLSLKIATEVSDLSSNGAIALQNISIPSLSVRRAETTVEMPSGSSMVIAGLLQQSTRQAIEGVPGAKDLPVLGSLFRSRDFLDNETEIVVIVTPYVVRPTDPKSIRTPLDGYENASDAAGFFRQRLNAVYRAPGAEQDGQKLEGPQGHILP